MIAVGLKLIPTGQGSKLREYYLRFEGSMYGVLPGLCVGCGER